MFSKTKLEALLNISFPPEIPEFLDIHFDSRKASSHTIFFDFTGNKEYIMSALTNGCPYAISALNPDQLPHYSERVIMRSHVRALFAKACKMLVVEQPKILAAITGTNGKSSTVDFLRQFWDKAGHKAASIGTIGFCGPKGIKLDLSLTTPEPLSFAKALNTLKENNIDHIAFEASSHGIEQHRVDVARVNYAAFTNLSQDHLDYHGTMENYFQAKVRLFTEVIEQDGVAVINMDDPYGKRLINLCRERGIKTSTYSTHDSKADVFGTIHTLTGNGIEVSIQAFGESLKDIKIPVVGNFQLENILCALVIVIPSTGLSLTTFSPALMTLTAPPGRMEYVGRTSLNGDVYVDYAHTPDALERALRSLKLHTQGHLVVLFGCGGDRDKTKRPLMGKIAQELADIVIVTDDNPRTEDAAIIRKSILSEAPKAIEIADRAHAIQEALNLLKEGDILLIAGKGHEQGQIIGHTTHPFCDKTIAHQAITQ